MSNIRQAKKEDLVRIAEIEIFNYRLNFYPILQGHSIGAELLDYAMTELDANFL